MLLAFRSQEPRTLSWLRGGTHRKPEPSSISLNPNSKETVTFEIPSLLVRTNLQEYRLNRISMELLRLLTPENFNNAAIRQCIFPDHASDLER